MVSVKSQGLQILGKLDDQKQLTNEVVSTMLGTAQQQLAEIMQKFGSEHDNLRSLSCCHTV